MLSMTGVSVGTAPTLIASVIAAGGQVQISNASSSTEVYLGTSTSVTPSNGFPIAAYGLVRLDNVAGGPLYGVTASGTVSVGFMYGNAFPEP
jgi:hypothetical protein